MTRNVPHRPWWNNGHSAAADIDPARYTEEFLDFITEYPTVFHAVYYYAHRLSSLGFTRLSERESWANLKKPGKYFVERNGSSLIAFIIGGAWEPGKGAAIIAGHVDALTARCKATGVRAIGSVRAAGLTVTSQ